MFSNWISPEWCCVHLWIFHANIFCDWPLPNFPMHRITVIIRAEYRTECGQARLVKWWRCVWAVHGTRCNAHCMHCYNTHYSTHTKHPGNPPKLQFIQCLIVIYGVYATPFAHIAFVIFSRTKRFIEWIGPPVEVGKKHRLDVNFCSKIHISSANSRVKCDRSGYFRWKYYMLFCY